MGRPKVKMIDDSQPEVEVKDQNSKIKNNQETVEVSKEKTGSVVEQPKKEAKSSDKKSKKETKIKRSKRYEEKREGLDKSHTYPVTEAVEIIRNSSYTKFVGTLEAHINTIGTGIRGLVTLPFASGKKIRIVAFGQDAALSGADIIGTEEVIEEINKGKINFDLMVTTSQWMPKLAKVARILGPRGIMPNPKNGTITDDIKKAVEGFQAGKTEYKTEGKAPVIHMNLGKLDQPTEELVANLKALVITLGKSRIKKITLAPTMGPSVKVNSTSL